MSTFPGKVGRHFHSMRTARFEFAISIIPPLLILFSVRQFVTSRIIHRRKETKRRGLIMAVGDGRGPPLRRHVSLTTSYRVMLTSPAKPDALHIFCKAILRQAPIFCCRNDILMHVGAGKVWGKLFLFSCPHSPSSSPPLPLPHHSICMLAHGGCGGAAYSDGPFRAHPNVCKVSST